MTICLHNATYRDSTIRAVRSVATSRVIAAAVSLALPWRRRQRLGDLAPCDARRAAAAASTATQLRAISRAAAAIDPARGALLAQAPRRRRSRSASRSARVVGLEEDPAVVPRGVRGMKIPTDSRLRLEQRRGLEQPDAPLEGRRRSPSSRSSTPVLSNDVGGNSFGTVIYRVTLRDRERARSCARRTRSGSSGTAEAVRPTERDELRRRAARGSPAPKSTRSPATAGHALTPARIRVRHSCVPSLDREARRRSRRTST